MDQLPVFVYGTLLPGQPNYMLWEQSIAAIEPAALLGAALYDLDWYPMLVAEPYGRVEGLLVTIRPDAYSQALSRLDFLEGYDPSDPFDGDYRREKRIVTSSGGTPSVGWVYVGRKAMVEGRPRIQTNWIAHLSHDRRTVSEWWQEVQSVGRKSGSRQS